jgi:hypothetical protein
VLAFPTTGHWVKPDSHDVSVGCCSRHGSERMAALEEPFRAVGLGRAPPRLLLQSCLERLRRPSVDADEATEHVWREVLCTS